MYTLFQINVTFWDVSANCSITRINTNEIDRSFMSLSIETAISSLLNEGSQMMIYIRYAGMIGVVMRYAGMMTKEVNVSKSTIYC